MKLRKNDEKLFTHVNDVTIPCLKPTYEKSTFLVKNGPSHRIYFKETNFVRKKV